MVVSYSHVYFVHPEVLEEDGEVLGHQFFNRLHVLATHLAGGLLKDRIVCVAGSLSR